MTNAVGLAKQHLQNLNNDPHGGTHKSHLEMSGTYPDNVDIAGTWSNMLNVTYMQCRNSMKEFWSPAGMN